MEHYYTFSKESDKKEACVEKKLRCAMKSKSWTMSRPISKDLFVLDWGALQDAAQFAYKEASRRLFETKYTKKGPPWTAEEYGTGQLRTQYSYKSFHEPWQ